VEILRGGGSLASVCAAPDGPVELAVLPRETLQGLLKSSALAERALADVAQQRAAENLAGRIRSDQ
jgi:hypothetical protein